MEIEQPALEREQLRSGRKRYQIFNLFTAVMQVPFLMLCYHLLQAHADLAAQTLVYFIV